MMIRALLLLLLAFTAFSQTATVKFKIGKVEYKRTGESNWRPVYYSTKFKQGDQLKTSFESRIEIRTPDKTIVRLGENSILDLNMIKKVGDKKSANKVKLWAGKLWAKFTTLFDDEEENTISTPTAVAAIRGTELGVNFNDGTGESNFTLYEGKIDVRTPKGTINLTPGNNAKVDNLGNTQVEKNKNSSSHGEGDQGNKDDQGEDEDKKDDEENEEDGEDLTDDSFFESDSIDVQGGGSGGSDEDTTPNFLNLEQTSASFSDAAEIAAGIQISGITRKDATLRVNGSQVQLAQDGSFSTAVSAREGKFKVTIMSNSNYGNITQALNFSVNISEPELFLDVDGESYTSEPAYNLAIQATDITPDDIVSVFINNRLVKAGASPVNMVEPLILTSGRNTFTVDVKDEAGHTMSQSFNLILDNREPQLLITSGTEPFTPTTSFGERPPGVPELPFILRPRLISGRILDSEPSSGIEVFRINGVQIDVKESLEFQYTLEMTDAIKKQIIDAYHAGGGDFIRIPVFVEDKAGNQYDDDIQIEIVIPTGR